ncbi:MAG: hypothetical protein PHU25_05685 [Deltaproteobacteria bacterium]|nr:hypothetical protein [Deltaproteobacteria bacterium]
MTNRSRPLTLWHVPWLFGIAILLTQARWVVASETPPCGATKALPPVLDPACRHRKDLQAELSLFGGSYLGASLGKSFLAGGRSYFHIDRMFAVGASYGFTRLFIGNRRFGETIEDRNVHLLSGELAISNDIAMRMGRQLLEMDLYLTLGAGALRLNEEWEALGVLGGGVKFYTGLPWLAVRLDVNTDMHGTHGAFDADFTVVAGLSLLFPARPSPLGH